MATKNRYSPDNLLFLPPTDLSNCQLVSFPDGVFKVLRSVSEDIRLITLADNEMKVICSKFFSTFTNLRGAAQYTPIHPTNSKIVICLWCELLTLNLKSCCRAGPAG